MTTTFNTMFPFSTAEQYLHSRRKDYHDLLSDLSESKDLGYVKVISPQELEVKGKLQQFKSHASLMAFILRTYW